MTERERAAQRYKVQPDGIGFAVFDTATGTRESAILPRYRADSVLSFILSHYGSN